MDALTEFLTAAFDTGERPEHPSVTRERERQDALKARGDSLNNWRTLVAASEPVESMTHDDFKRAREAVGLSTADVAAVTGIHTQDVEAFESRGGEVVGSPALRQFMAAAFAVVTGAQTS